MSSIKVAAHTTNEKSESGIDLNRSFCLCICRRDLKLPYKSLSVYNLRLNIGTLNEREGATGNIGRSLNRRGELLLNSSDTGISFTPHHVDRLRVISVTNDVSWWSLHW
jgi:hypothetical protein